MMALNHNPTPHSPDRSFALQKYLLLHSQNDAIQRRLSETQAPHEPLSSPEHHPRTRRNSSLSSTTSITSSHTRSTSQSFTPIYEEIPLQQTYDRPPLNRSRRSSLPPSLSSTNPTTLEDDEQQLLNVNQQIKTVLTDLLNREDVKRDQVCRMWVQEKLMEAEREMKGCKIRSGRRRSCVCDWS